LRKEIFAYLKEAASLSSKIFMGFTILNLTISFFTGNVDEASEYILSNLVAIVVCVTSLVIFDKVRLGYWPKILLSYVVIVGMLQGYTWLSGQLFRELMPGAYLESLISTTIVFVVVWMAGEAADYLKVKTRGNEEQSNK